MRVLIERDDSYAVIFTHIIHKDICRILQHLFASHATDARWIEHAARLIQHQRHRACRDGAIVLAVIVISNRSPVVVHVTCAVPLAMSPAVVPV